MIDGARPFQGSADKAYRHAILSRACLYESELHPRQPERVADVELRYIVPEDHARTAMDAFDDGTLP